LLFNAAFLCGENPPFPTDPAVLAQVQMQLALAAGDGGVSNQTDRQLSEFRQTHAPCMYCHPGFDPYGVALGNYDTLGAFKTADSMGRPIDPSTTLPPLAGSAVVHSGVEMAKALASSGAFVSCMTKNVIQYALADPVVAASLQSCSTSDIAQAAKAGGGSFTSMVTEIAASQTLTVRSPGGAQ
jgi:hypothetical protein